MEIDREGLYDHGVLSAGIGWQVPRLPGLGEIRWDRFISALYKVGYDYCVVVEHEDRQFEGTDEQGQGRLPPRPQRRRAVHPVTSHPSVRRRECRCADAGHPALGWVGHSDGSDDAVDELAGRRVLEDQLAAAVGEVLLLDHDEAVLGRAPALAMRGVVPWRQSSSTGSHCRLADERKQASITALTT